MQKSYRYAFLHDFLKKVDLPWFGTPKAGDSSINLWIVLLNGIYDINESSEISLAQKPSLLGVIWPLVIIFVDCFQCRWHHFSQ